MKKKSGAATASIRSRRSSVFMRTPSQRQGLHVARNKSRVRRIRRREDRGMTSVENTSRSVTARTRIPAGRAIHRMEQPYSGFRLPSAGLP